MLFKGVICCSRGGGLYAVQEGYMDAQEGHVLFRGVICCSGELFEAQEGLYYSGALYTVQGGCMLFRGVICYSGGLCVEENNDVLVATSIVASRPPECQHEQVVKKL